MHEAFIEKNFRPASMATIAQAVTIIRQYREEGYTLTLRQLYYQFVARDLIPNSERSYKSLGKLITDARMAGLIDWEAIEDRGRGATSWLINENERHALYGIDQRFALDYWTPQDTYVEVWVEKEALSAVVRRPAMRWNAPYMACKGYLSASEAYRAGKRFEEACDQGKRAVLIHLGDHDPSGIDMTRDNGDRLELFSFGHDIDVRRIALNRDQIDAYGPPPNPAKMSDSRAEDYVREHGYTSWELDALEPSVIEGLIESELTSLIDMDIWRETQAREQEVKRVLRAVPDAWDDIRETVERFA